MSDPTPLPTSEPSPETAPGPSPSSAPAPSPVASGADRPLFTRRRLFALGGAAVAVGGAAWLGTRLLGGGATASPDTGSPSAAPGSAASGSFLASDRVHTVSLTAKADALAAVLQAYRASAEKTWLETTLTIDGVQHDQVGIRLKGNSSLKTLLAGSSKDPGMEELPWLVRIDKYVKGQSHEGLREFVIRSNSTTTALNEAVALDLLDAAGLATQKAAYIRLSANSSAEKLRLVIENPAEDWAARVFDGEGILYKAEATGDWTYRGTDASAYDEVFDVEAGEENLQPLTSFLDFVNNSADADFPASLPSRLEVDAFATYLAFETVIDNFDDIDGPGNNSMLWWSKPTTRMTVVAWDHNLAFGSRPGAGGAGGGQAAGGQRPTGGQFTPGATPGANFTPGQLPDGVPNGQLPQGIPTGQLPSGMPGAMPTGVPGSVPTGMPTQSQPGGQADQGDRRGGGMQGKANALVNRFSTLHSAKIDEAKTRLKQQFYTDGAAKQSLERWAGLVSGSASDLVDSAALAHERATIEAYFG